MYKKIFKRLIDLLISFVAILVLSPVLFTIALLVRIKLGKPVIFKQKRPGLNERIFTIYKFRTMNNSKDKNGMLLPDCIRLTKFGAFLRSTSLDELPELFNILVGNMSFIGPRPQLIEDMLFMTLEQRKRHSVHPGLSGLAQINGRNNISWEDKLNYDLQYINKITFYGDIIIFIKTIFNVIRRDNINTEGMATTEDFGDYLLHTNQICKDEYLATMEKLSDY